MTTIYKNNGESSWTEYVLCVEFSDNINRQIDDWQADLNKLFFDEQIKTGSFHGRFPIDDHRRIRMKRLLEKGIIQPYYGATGANACIYALQVTPPKCIIGVEHEAAEKKVSYEDTVTILQTDTSITVPACKKGFIIEEKEYRTLQQWECWNEKEEFTSRYLYKFAPGSIGLSITVIDTQTKEQMDITDYKGW